MVGASILFGIKKSDRSIHNEIGEVLARANGFKSVDEAGRFFSRNTGDCVLDG
jgi:hypothetical protein